MTISSYAELQTAISSWVNPGGSSTVLSGIVADLITLAEKRINREVRTADMETSYTGTIASGVIAVPTDFLAWKVVYIDATPVRMLSVKPLDTLMRDYPTRATDSTPYVIARNGANFEFGPYPDSAYTVKGTYYKRLTSVSSSWNALATANPDLYLMASLCEAAPYVRDADRIALWEAKYKAIKDAINEEATGADISGGSLRMAPA